jgi:signal transduction histidine kinase
MFTLVQNLINNAIKYNREGGTISITTHFVEDHFVIEIEDTGIGIEQEQVSIIFDRFKRLNKNSAEGYGLGLPIVRTIAAFHGIETTVRSRPDIGTTFSLIFPKNEA